MATLTRAMPEHMGDLLHTIMSEYDEYTALINSKAARDVDPAVGKHHHPASLIVKSSFRLDLALSHSLTCKER